MYNNNYATNYELMNTYIHNLMHSAILTEKTKSIMRKDTVLRNLVSAAYQDFSDNNYEVI